VADVARAPAAKLANGRKHEPPMSEQNVDEDDGDPTSSLPWSASGCMTYRAENQKARDVKTSNPRGDRTFGERGIGAQSHHH
jgi:hypothetical protein